MKARADAESDPGVGASLCTESERAAVLAKRAEAHQAALRDALARGGDKRPLKRQRVVSAPVATMDWAQARLADTQLRDRDCAETCVDPETGLLILKPLPVGYFWVSVMAGTDQRAAGNYEVRRWGNGGKAPPKADLHHLELRWDKPRTFSDLCGDGPPYLVILLGWSHAPTLESRPVSHVATTLLPGDARHAVTEGNTVRRGGRWLTQLPHVLVEWEECPLAPQQQQPDDDDDDGLMDDDTEEDGADAAATLARGRAAHPWSTVPIRALHLVVVNGSLRTDTLEPMWMFQVDVGPVLERVHGRLRYQGLLPAPPDHMWQPKDDGITMADVPQRSIPWFSLRLRGNCGATGMSRVFDVEGEGGARGEYRQTQARTRFKKQRVDRRTKQPVPGHPSDWPTPAMFIGREYEPWIVHVILTYWPHVRFAEAGWHWHPTVPRAGCSPDGLLEDVRMSWAALQRARPAVAARLLREGGCAVRGQSWSEGLVEIKMSVGSDYISAKNIMQMTSQCTVTDRPWCILAKAVLDKGVLFWWRFVVPPSWKACINRVISDPRVSSDGQAPRFCLSLIRDDADVQTMLMEMDQLAEQMRSESRAMYSDGWDGSHLPSEDGGRLMSGYWPLPWDKHALERANAQARGQSVKRRPNRAKGDKYAAISRMEDTELSRWRNGLMARAPFLGRDVPSGDGWLRTYMAADATPLPTDLNAMWRPSDCESYSEVGPALKLHALLRGAEESVEKTWQHLKMFRETLQRHITGHSGQALPDLESLGVRSAAALRNLARKSTELVGNLASVRHALVHAPSVMREDPVQL